MLNTCFLFRESETCKSCGLEIKMPDLPKHILSHILPGQKCCRICKYKSQTGKYLEEHYNIHYNLKPFKCQICTRGFAMQSYLKSHTQQVHESNRRYQCRYCDKRFVRPCHQKSHEKVHQGQGESLPPIQRIKTPAAPKPSVESCNSDSNNSNTRPTLSSFSESNSGSSPSSHQHSNSPNLVALTPFAGKPEQTWAPPVPGQWPSEPMYWSNSNPYVPPALPPPPDKWDEFAPPQFDTTNWSPPSYYAPIIKTDVNWTAANSTSDQSWQNQAPPFQASINSESAWSDHSTGTYTTPTPPPTNSSVQDLWAELHYEEMKLFPEASSTVFTADGIPMTTELTGLDAASFQLPGGRPELTTIGDTKQVITSHLTETDPALLHSAPGANWKPQGRAIAKSKTRVTAEVRHRMNTNNVAKSKAERPAPAQHRATRMVDPPQDEDIDYDE